MTDFRKLIEAEGGDVQVQAVPRDAIRLDIIEDPSGTDCALIWLTIEEARAVERALHKAISSLEPPCKVQRVLMENHSPIDIDYSLTPGVLNYF